MLPMVASHPPDAIGARVSDREVACVGVGPVDEKLLTLNDGKQEARHHQEPRDEPYEPCHLDVSHAEGLGQTMSKRSVWIRVSGTPSSASALSAASIIGAGPQMKN